MRKAPPSSTYFPASDECGHGEGARAGSPLKGEMKHVCRLGGESDVEGMVELFRSHNYGLQKVEWLRWKYFDNPDGHARIFLCEDADRKIIGLRAHMPRYFTSAKTGTFFARHSVDMFVAKAQRRAGVDAAIWKFCRSNGDYPIIGFPNKLSKRLTKNMPGDVRIYHPMDEWWYPLAVGRLIHLKWQSIGALADALSRLYALLWLGRSPKAIRMTPLERFRRDYCHDLEYIQGLRSARFLNWRFIDNPMRSFCVYEFLDSNHQSGGYCVYAIDDSAASIYDLVLNRRARKCLKLLVDHLREQQLSHVTFKSIGFRMRKYGFIRLGSPGDMDALNTPSGKWRITLADKD
jgi:hypothetical protein